MPTGHPRPWLCMLAVAVTQFLPTPVARADVATLDQLDGVAVRIAKAGRAEEALELIDVMLNLGLPADDASDLMGRCNDALRAAAKRGPKKGALSVEARGLRRVAEELGETLGTLDDDEALALARQILRLDADVEAAQRQLGRELHDGSWRPPGETERAARREVIVERLREARAFPVDVEIGPCEHDLARTILGAGATTASFGATKVHSTWSEEKITRSLREAVRATAFLHGVVTGACQVPNLPRRDWILTPTMNTYKKGIDVVEKRGRLPPHVARNARKLTGFHLDPSITILFRHTEVSLETSLITRLFDVLEFGEPSMPVRTTPPALRAALEHWTCTTYFGAPMTGRVFYEDGEMSRSGPGTGSVAPLDREKERQRDELMRMSKGGIHGVRAYMAWLASRGEDPRWTEAMKPQLGQLTASELLKTTLVFQYLLESTDIPALFGRFERARKEAKGQQRNLGIAIETSYDEFEARWREWILPDDKGLAARLDGSAIGAPDDDARAALEHLSEIRRAALHRVGDARPDVSLDADISIGCVAHAEYLKVHKDQATSWPDAHEQFPDREGFSTHGAWAAGHSVIASKARSGTAAIDAWMGSFYHRLPLLEPGLVRIGYGRAGTVVVLDAKSLSAPWHEAWTVTWPPDKRTDVPRSFAPELPNPVPGADQRRFGTCVTVQRVPRFDGDVAGAVTFTLREGSPQGPVVDAYVSTPDVPTNPDLAPKNAYALIPKARLKANTTYHAHFRVGSDRPIGWRFTTGRK